LFLKLTSTSFFDDLCKKASDGTTNSVRLQADKFFNLEIELPSVKEQTHIIESFYKVENYNNQITTELSHQLELVCQLRQAFLREAMQGKLVE
jgi:type I restriction enzyme S subunit